MVLCPARAAEGERGIGGTQKPRAVQVGFGLDGDGIERPDLVRRRWRRSPGLVWSGLRRVDQLVAAPAASGVEPAKRRASTHRHASADAGDPVIHLPKIQVTQLLAIRISAQGSR